MQYEVDLAELGQVTAIRKGLLSDLLQEVRGYDRVLIFVYRRIYEFHLRANNVMKSNQENVVNLFSVRRFEITQ